MSTTTLALHKLPTIANGYVLVLRAANVCATLSMAEIDVLNSHKFDAVIADIC